VFVAEVREARQLPPPSLPEVAFAGRSNVGKSTLLNAICQRHGLARTSRTPGCTRGVILFDLKFRSGATVRLADLPGYGFADRSKGERRSWGPLIEGYLRHRKSLRAVAVLVDARRGPETEELGLCDFLAVHGVPFFLVATKIDKMSRAERGIALATLARQVQTKIFATSGTTREGRDEVVHAILRLATTTSTS
jgi:GTP-binding protein